MEYFAGIEVSLKDSSVGVIDAAGRIVREAKVVSEPEASDRRGRLARRGGQDRRRRVTDDPRLDVGVQCTGSAGADFRRGG